MEGYFYFVSNIITELNSYYILYQEQYNNYTTWKSSPIVTNYKVVKFKEVNYYIEKSLTELNLVEDDIFKYTTLDDYYLDYSEIFDFTINLLNIKRCYFKLIPPTDSLITTININKYKRINSINDARNNVPYALYIDKQPIIVKNNFLYYYHEVFNHVKDLDDNYYILLIDYGLSSLYIES
jgi:hypothetical protein